MDGGGLATSSAKYSLHGSMSAGGAVVSAKYKARGGFAGQLSEVLGLTLTAAPSAPLLERGTSQLGAFLTLDDDSRLVPGLSSLVWMVTSGPLVSISAGGLVSAGSVYQNTPGTVEGTYLGFSDGLEITVVNTGLDDFGGYAEDGLPDAWQVGYFGESGLPALANLSGDGDGDSLTNLQEFAFGTSPLVNSSAAVDWLGSSLLARGTPRVFTSTAPGSFTFRAVFSRRLGYVAARLKYTVEFSANLSTWQASTATPAVLASDGEFQVVSVPYPFAVGNRKATYFRVRVELLP